MDDGLASICAGIACSPADSGALVQVALKSIPLSVKDIFDVHLRSLQTLRNIGRDNADDFRFSHCGLCISSDEDQQ